MVNITSQRKDLEIMVQFPELQEIQYSYRPEIMQDVTDRLKFMIGHHCKVLVMRIDVRFPEKYPHDGKNTDLSELMRQFTQYFSYHGILCHYTWVREQDSSDHPHYHIVIFFDGSRVEDGSSIMARASYIWNRIMGVDCWGCIHLCLTSEGANGIMIRRPSQKSEGAKLQVETESFNAAYRATVEWSSYLAKTRSKGSAPRCVREYQSSQL